MPHAQGPRGAGDAHPTMQILGQTWEHVGKLMSSELNRAGPVSEAFAALCRSAFATGGIDIVTLMAELLGALAVTFENTGDGPAAAGCLEALGRAVETFGANPACAESFSGLLERVVAQTAAVVGSRL